jgi:nucleoid DNA-binding protein
MIGQPVEPAKYIVNQLDAGVFKVKNKKQRLKLIKLIIEQYAEFIQSKLVKNEAMVITNVGRLTPMDYHIGAKNNPFTGEWMEAREVKRIKFIPSIILKRKLKE